MEVMTIKLEDELYTLLKKNLKPYYSTKTEFVREAIRDKLKKIEKEKIINELYRLKGSGKKNPKNLNEKDYEEMLTNIESGKTSQKLRKLNLERINS